MSTSESQESSEGDELINLSQSELEEDLIRAPERDLGEDTDSESEGSSTAGGVRSAGHRARTSSDSDLSEGQPTRRRPGQLGKRTVTQMMARPSPRYQPNRAFVSEEEQFVQVNGRDVPLPKYRRMMERRAEVAAAQDVEAPAAPAVNELSEDDEATGVDMDGIMNNIRQLSGSEWHPRPLPEIKMKYVRRRERYIANGCYTQEGVKLPCQRCLYDEPRQYSVDMTPGSSDTVEYCLQALHNFWIANCCTANLDTVFSCLEEKWREYFIEPFVRNGLRVPAPRLNAVHFEFHYRECNPLFAIPHLRDQLEDLQLTIRDIQDNGMFIEQRVGGVSTGNLQFSSQLTARFIQLTAAYDRTHQYLCNMYLTLQGMTGTPQVLPGMAIKPVRATTKELLNASAPRIRGARPKGERRPGLFNH